IAALHPGFPVSDVDLTSRDVWVTNGERLLGGRLNKQIDELNASITTTSPATEVLQRGDDVYVVDPDNHRLESVDPATTAITSSVDLPPDAEVSYGGDVLAVVADGDLWALSSIGDLRLDVVSQPPLLELGDGGHAVVTPSGAIIAIAPEKKKAYRIATLADEPVESAFPKIGDSQLAAIGETAVALDESTNELVLENGTVRPLGDERALRLQQSGPASDRAVLATGSGLLSVSLGSGEVQTIDAEVSASTSDPDDVAAPVNLDGCVHGAWAQSQRYLLACAGEEPAAYDIDQPTAGSALEFRVNRSIVVLNDLDNGNVWLPAENMRLVDNWDDVVPPEVEETEEEGDDKSALQSFEDTLAERTDENRAPTAVDDEFGIREGRTTILSVLDNDTDPDGDVLVVSKHGEVNESTGHLDFIDGSRALQFTPAPGFVGTINFDYTVDDGRGGTATAHVTARVVPDGANQQPVELRRSAVSVEANQTIEYNVLANWRDPDGDELFLVGAAPTSGDLVRFTPDGVITFTHQTSELGEKEVQFQVTDGAGDSVTGTLIVDVKPAGTLDPIGTPDFATAFVGEQVTVKPLENDLSPNGAPLALTGIEDPGEGTTATLDTDDGTVRFEASAAGIYYFTYTLQAGPASSVGIVRVDVQELPADLAIPPVAVKDTAYLRPDQPTTVSVLSNDVSPTGRILAVQSVSVPADVQAKGVVVELLESTLIRVNAPQALTSQVSFTYTISDGLNTASAGVTVVPVPALTKHQPPIAVDDDVTVRAGDIATVHVLENDRHPDDSRMFLDDELVTGPSDGL
ncbi:tandem-95 repeat protein, partial [Schumannella luteola]